MDNGMSNREQTILVVSDDAALCAAARREFEAGIAGRRGASVTSVAAARRLLEADAPAVVLFEETCIAPEAEGPRGIVPRLRGGVTALAGFAPRGRIGAG